MKIYPEQIPAEGMKLEGEEPAEVLAVEDGLAQFGKPLHYDLLATIVGSGLLVRGRLWTTGTLECGRCLKKCSFKLAVEDFLFEEEIGNKQVFDLTENLREDILLQLPQRALCSPTCKGLCPSCGQNLNAKKCKCKPRSVSSQWDALSKLKL